MASPVNELMVEITPRARSWLLRWIPFLRDLIIEQRVISIEIRLTNIGSQNYSGGVLELELAQYGPGLVPQWAPWRKIDIPPLAPGKRHDKTLQPEYLPYSGYWNIKPACHNTNLKGKAREEATWQVVIANARLEVFLICLTVISAIAALAAAIAAIGAMVVTVTS